MFKGSLLGTTANNSCRIDTVKPLINSDVIADIYDTISSGHITGLHGYRIRSAFIKILIEIYQIRYVNVTCMVDVTGYTLSQATVATVVTPGKFKT